CRAIPASALPAAPYHADAGRSGRRSRRPRQRRERRLRYDAPLRSVPRPCRRRRTIVPEPKCRKCRRRDAWRAGPAAEDALVRRRGLEGRRRKIRRELWDKSPRTWRGPDFSETPASEGSGLRSKSKSEPSPREDTADWRRGGRSPVCRPRDTGKARGAAGAIDQIAHYEKQNYQQQNFFGPGFHAL